MTSRFYCLYSLRGNLEQAPEGCLLSALAPPGACSQARPASKGMEREKRPREASERDA